MKTTKREGRWTKQQPVRLSVPRLFGRVIVSGRTGRMVGLIRNIWKKPIVGIFLCILILLSLSQSSNAERWVRQVTGEQAEINQFLAAHPECDLKNVYRPFGLTLQAWFLCSDEERLNLPKMYLDPSTYWRPSQPTYRQYNHRLQSSSRTRVIRARLGRYSWHRRAGGTGGLCSCWPLLLR